MEPITINEKLFAHHTALSNIYGKQNVLATMLYGSQNYNLATETSDVDTKALILPTFNEVVLNKKWLSVEHVVDDGLANAKDIRAMFENFLKSNINFLEILFSEYGIVNEDYLDEYMVLSDNRDLIANCQPCRLMHAAGGMASQKFHALEKPFESKTEVLAKFGYDPKQLHHLIRLDIFLTSYLKTHNFGECLVPSDADREYLFFLKKGSVTLAEAKCLANDAMNRVDNLIKEGDRLFTNDDPTQVKELLDCLAVDLIRKHIKSQL